MTSDSLTSWGLSSLTSTAAHPLAGGCSVQGPPASQDGSLMVGKYKQ